MSFAEYKECISEGDTVIIFLGHNQMQTIVVTPGKVHQTKYGALPHSDMIGRTFGTKMFSVNEKGWVYLLHPTPELWTVNLPHRTQILYTTDISMVLLQLDIKPGSVVVESGTGSGSMSHAIIRSLAPTGHLYTFEFHEQRAEQARTEFEQHKISELVTVEHRDVCKNGFGLNHVADAVFLDLPSPWDAIGSAKETLKTEGGRICSFSPCIEQVQKACDSMRSHGFRDINVMECLLRSFDVKTVALPIPNFSTTAQENGAGKNQKLRKRKLEEDSREEPENKECTDVKVTKESSSKPPETNEASKQVAVNTETSSPSNTDRQSSSIRNTRTLESQKPDSRFNMLTAKPCKQMPGHTGYLTFATLFPRKEDKPCEETE